MRVEEQKEGCCPSYPGHASGIPASSPGRAPRTRPAQTLGWAAPPAPEKGRRVRERGFKREINGFEELRKMKEEHVSALRNEKEEWEIFVPILHKSPLSIYFTLYQFLSLSLLKPHVPTIPRQNSNHPSTHLMPTYLLPLTTRIIIFGCFISILIVFACIHTIFLHQFIT